MKPKQLKLGPKGLFQVTITIDDEEVTEILRTYLYQLQTDEIAFEYAHPEDLAANEECIDALNIILGYISTPGTFRPRHKKPKKRSKC